MAYELRTEKYSGPLDKLLALIEERKLEINELSLATVTDDFLRYLESLSLLGTPEAGEGESRMRIIADFVVIASRLIFIKSRSLLPGIVFSADEEADIKDLENRLKFYQSMRPAMKHIASQWKSKRNELGRPYLWGVSEKVFYPPASITPMALQASLLTLLTALQQYIVQNRVVREAVISMEEKIKEVLDFLSKMKKTTFSNLSEAKTKTETIIAFLAILHLAREQVISLEQQGHLSDIIIRTSEPSSSGSPKI